MQLIIEGDRQFRRAVMLHPGIAGVPNDREQPGPAIATVKAAEVPKSAQVSFLYYAFGIRIVASEPAGQIVCRSQMRQCGFFKILQQAFHIAPQSPSGPDGSSHSLICSATKRGAFTGRTPRSIRLLISPTPSQSMK